VSVQFSYVARYALKTVYVVLILANNNVLCLFCFTLFTMFVKLLCFVYPRPIVIEVPHCASIRDREREVIVLRSDNGQTWREHVTPADDTPLRDTPTNPPVTGGILGLYTLFL